MGRKNPPKQASEQGVAQNPQELSQSTASDSVSSQDEIKNEVESLKQSLTPESQALVRILTLIITQQFADQIATLKNELEKKEAVITKLQQDVTTLSDEVENLKQHIDNVEQYERRDTVLLSGPVLPDETPQENTTQVVITSIKDNLRINITDRDINIAHRIGSSAQQRKRPIIVKLTNRSLKHDLQRACVNLKPQLYINESLTPARLHILKQVLTIKKSHKAKFQQCYTSDGKIVIKLKNSTQKHIITDNKSLMVFLEMYPEMMDTHLEATTQQPWTAVPSSYTKTIILLLTWTKTQTVKVKHYFSLMNGVCVCVCV